MGGIRAAVAGAAADARRAAGLTLPLAPPAFQEALAGALALEAQAGRLFLLLPLMSIAGVLAFFAADRDPWWPAALALLAGTGAAVWLARRRPLAFPMMLGACAFAFGFASATLEVERVRAPILKRAMHAQVIGRVESVDPTPRGPKVHIAVERFGSLAPEGSPRRVRITLPRRSRVQAGERVGVTALWLPPPGPSRALSYDFAREAFFQGIGAVGQRAERPQMLAEQDPGLAARARAAIDRLRNALTARIAALLPGDTGAVTAAMVTGQRGEISAATEEAMRNSGLYHLLSISGTHMALVGGAIFWAVRLMLVAVPGLALRVPVKKHAAAAAIAGCAFYLALSGAEVATQRSFVMMAAVFLAVIIDRPALSLRNLAIAVFAAVTVAPSAVVGPSFQMSFAAVLGILAWVNRPRAAPEGERAGGAVGLISRGGEVLSVIAITSIIATIATTPFVAYHFQRLQMNGLAGNVLALPVVEFVVMPFSLLAVVLYPLGLDAPAWAAAGLGVEVMRRVAEWVGSWPYSSIPLRAFSLWPILLVALGLVMVAIFTTRLRWLGAPLVAAGIFGAATPPRYDLHVDAAARAAAVRGPDGALVVIGARQARFAAGIWLAADADPRSPRDGDIGEGVRCDSSGCTAPLRHGGHLALSWRHAALREDCVRAAIIVTRLPVPPDCRAGRVVIDGADLARMGALSARLEQGRGGLVIAELAPARPPAAERAWHNRPRIPAGPAIWDAPAAKAEPPPQPEDEEAPEDAEDDQ